MLKNKLSILKLFMLILLSLGIQDSFAQNGVTSGANESGTSGTTFIVIIVFLVLIVLYLFFKRFGSSKSNELSGSAEVQNAASPELDQDRISGEVNAAIAMALYLYSSEIHDMEDPVITMVRVSRTYSPWSSKIYGLRKLPR